MDIKIDYKPHKFQKQLHDDQSRYIVVTAGRRFGKSVFARMHCLLNALHDPGLYWIISPTYRQGKMIHWHELKKEVPPELISYKNEQELSMHLTNGSRIELKGADNEDALRGVGLKGVVLDEAADQKPLVWEEIIRPTLVDSKGWAIFIGTPKGFNWFYDLWLRGSKSSKTYDPQWSSYRFTSYDNPFLPDGEIDKAKSEATGADKDDTFSQEYMAEFKKFSGLIYKNFDRNIHLTGEVEVSEYQGWDIFRAIDFGFDNPTVCLWIAVSPDNKWYVIDEYYESKQSSDYHCGIIMAKTAQYPLPVASYGDPSGAQIMADWAQRGVYVTGARRDASTNRGEWVGHGIDIIQEKLKVSVMDQKPQLFIRKTCENTLREFETYRWKEEKDSQMNNPGRPEKSNDHAMDALRYFAVSYPGKQEPYYEEETKNWSLV